MINKILNEDPVPIETLRPDLPEQAGGDREAGDAQGPQGALRLVVRDGERAREHLPAARTLLPRDQLHGEVQQAPFAPFFREFRDAELWEVLRGAVWETHSRDENLLLEGEVGQAFFIIVGGQVKVVKDGKLLERPQGRRLLRRDGLPFGRSRPALRLDHLGVRGAAAEDPGDPPRVPLSERAASSGSTASSSAPSSSGSPGPRRSSPNSAARAKRGQVTFFLTLFDEADRLGRDAFAAARESQLLVAGGLDVHVARADARSAAMFDHHRRDVRRHARRLGDDRGIDVHDERGRGSSTQRRHLAKQTRGCRCPCSAHRCRGSACRCRRAPRRPSKRIADRVQQHIRVAVAEQALLCANMTPPMHELAARDERVDVESLADAHAEAPRSPGAAGSSPAMARSSAKVTFILLFSPSRGAAPGERFHRLDSWSPSSRVQPLCERSVAEHLRGLGPPQLRAGWSRRCVAPSSALLQRVGERHREESPHRVLTRARPGTARPTP